MAKLCGLAAMSMIALAATPARGQVVVWVQNVPPPVMVLPATPIQYYVPAAPTMVPAPAQTAPRRATVLERYYFDASPSASAFPRNSTQTAPLSRLPIASSTRKSGVIIREYYYVDPQGDLPELSLVPAPTAVPGDKLELKSPRDAFRAEPTPAPKQADSNAGKQADSSNAAKPKSGDAAKKSAPAEKSDDAAGKSKAQEKSSNPNG